MSFLDGLSPAQREAAGNFEGASLIIAGAGSGKTRTLTYRIAHMIESGVAPYNILALTFTNKAAAEMRERIASVMPVEALRGLWMGTFHSIFRRILNAEAAVIGYPENFTLYDTADSTSLVKTIIKEMQLDEEKYKPKDVFSRISLAKNSLVTPAAYEGNAQAREEDSAARRPEIYRIYALYAKRCKANGAMDFDDLLLQMNYLLRDHPEVGERYASMFRYIMVDEYQDTNYSQYLIVKKLAALHRNICVVGDDSQSIYSFRGARIENILRFEQDFPEAKVFRLEQNYRSTKVIVEASNSLIEHNKGKLKKNLFSDGAKGELIRVVETYSDKDEAARVVGDIASTIYKEDAIPSDFAILYRTHFQGRVLEEFLRSKGIAYKIYGGNSFYSRAEIKTMLCYLRLAVNPADDEALKRVVNYPARGIGDGSIAKVEAMAQQRGVSMFEILRTVPPAEIGIRGVAVKGIGRFVETFAQLSNMAVSLDAYEFATEVASRSGLLALYRASGAVEDKTRLDNIDELISSIKDFKPSEDMGEDATEGAESTEGLSIAQWLAEVSLLSEADTQKEDDTPKVALLTVHASKGLEFKYVYIVGMEEKLFPSIRQEFSESEIEEERRLFYVAMTRAKSKVTLSYALSRFQWGEVKSSLPSRFIKEIDQSYIDMSLCEAQDDRPSTTTQKFGGRFGGGRFSGGGSTTPRFGQKQSADQKPKPAQGNWLSSLSTSAPKNLKRVARSEGVSVEQAGEVVVGAKVSHERFGRGEVISLEQTANDTKLTINFDGIGQKVLLKRFAKLTIL